MIKNCLAMLLLLLATIPSGAAATFSMKRGINLDNWTTWPDESRWNDQSVLLPFPEWRRTIDGSDLRRLKDAGFDFVRMPIDPSPFLSSQTSGFRERLYEDVLAAARLVNAAGLKVVVDLHLIPAGANRAIGMTQVMEDPALFDRYVGIVRTMARTLSGEDPGNVALEVMNEPVTGCTTADAAAWMGKLRQLFAAARASATKMTLILSGGCWGTAEGLSAVDPADIPDDNIIWSFHSYAPFLLTHQGATWAGDFIPYVTGLPYPLQSVSRSELDDIIESIRSNIRNDASWTRRSGLLAYLDEQIALIDTPTKLETVMDTPFREVSAWADKHAIPPQDIVLGEFGMIRQEYGNPAVMPGAWRAAYIRDMIDFAEKRGFSWSVWSYGGAFGVVEEFEGRKAEPDVLDMVRALPE